MQYQLVPTLEYPKSDYISLEQAILNQETQFIIWNFNDLNTSHVDPAVIYRVLADIDAEYGKIAKMTITQGKVHKYLGITID